jgi:NAD(P)-dependent dehydrogenase (short-subunit alcohol dehydrogenase family)
MESGMAVQWLEGKRVLVVGGTSGMGQAVAETARALGARVWIASSRAERGTAVAEAIGADGVELDLSSPTSIEKAAGTFDHVDHLVVTAQSARGVATITPLERADMGAVEQIFAVKLFGVFRLIKALIPVFARDGSITLFSGAASRRVIPGHVALGAVNGAIEAAGRQLAKELAPVRVNVISPGLVRTPAYDAMPEDRREAMFRARAEVLPAGRVGVPEDIALAVIHLMQNTFVTGTVQDVDGGGLLT